ncbi:MAG: DUF488 domain-containing protein [Leucobacter sp.]
MTISVPEIHVARIYDSLTAESSGDADDSSVRVLVDRLWPRGVSRDEAAIDLWPKVATPSADLRKSWHADPHGQDPAQFGAFQDAYREELANEPARSALSDLVSEVADASRILLLTATKTPDISHVPVFLAALTDALRSR